MTLTTPKRPNARPRRTREEPAGSAGVDPLRALTVVVVTATCLFVFLQLRPSLLFADTTPTGGELGGHAWGPEFLRSHLWSGGGFLSGWTDDWFGGFPAFRFSLPVLALGAVLIDLVTPAGVALKLTVALPLVALPVAAARFARSSGLGGPGPAALAAASLVALFDVSHHQFGGNILSAITGEYASGTALVVGLVCVAVFNQDLDEERSGPAAGALAALAALCHPVGATFVFVGVVCRSVVTPAGQRLAAWAHVARTLGLTALLTAFWYLPAWWYRPYSNELRFPHFPNHGELLFPLWFPLEIVVATAAVAGTVEAVVHRRRGVIALAMAAALFALGVMTVPRGLLWNTRLVPPWLLCRALLAGAGAAALLGRLARHAPVPRRRHVQSVATAALVATLLLGLAWDTAMLPGGRTRHVTENGERLAVDFRWILGPHHLPSLVADGVREAFGGYERNPFWEEHVALIETLKGVAQYHGCGRVMPEYDASGHLGSPYATALLPLRTDGCLPTATGLLMGSSPTASAVLVAESSLSPIYSNYKPGLRYEPFDLDRGVEYMREIGARYYLAHTPTVIEAARLNPNLTQVAASGPWHVYLVEGVSLVETLERQPIVIRDADRDALGWERVALEWFQQARPTAFRVAWSGPPDWTRASPGVPLPEQTHQLNASDISEVHDLVDEPGHIRFRVSNPGAPIIVRRSYFPTWKVKGARGPWRITPNWMVVIPTGDEVELTYEAGTAAWVGVALSALGVAATFGWAARSSQARSRSRSWRTRARF